MRQLEMIKYHLDCRINGHFHVVGMSRITIPSACFVCCSRAFKWHIIYKRFGLMDGKHNALDVLKSAHNVMKFFLACKVVLDYTTTRVCGVERKAALKCDVQRSGG